MISDKNNEDKHFVAPYSKEVSFDELQDAPPSGKFRLSITGKLGVIVVAFWLFVAARCFVHTSN